MTSRRHRTDEDALIRRVILHADAVAQECPLGEGRRRVHGKHGHATTLRSECRDQRTRRGRLAHSGSPGDADDPRMPRGRQKAQRLGGLGAGILDQGQQPCHVAVAPVAGSLDQCTDVMPHDHASL